MENTIDIKKRIHEFINHADERILRIINAIITTEENTGEELTAEHQLILDKRMENHKENPNSGKSWDDIKNLLSN